jgi:hypothetical protein
MTWINNIRIEIERLRYRRSKARKESRDISRQLKYIAKADKLSLKRKCRLWVVRIEPGRYRIYSKSDIKAVLRRLGLKGRIDLFSVNGTVVHITKYHAVR